jgi:acyl phosphate:glycerol-3-phosphate acyltransferase
VGLSDILVAVSERRPPSMNPVLGFALVALVAFVAGSVPFAPWILRLVGNGDATADLNPGAMTAYRVGGPAVGIAVLLLDVTKGVFPVVLAQRTVATDGWMLAIVAVLPVAGAAFSPFLRFRGGKALAVTLGTWIGLTVWSIPIVALLAIVIATLLITPNAWAVSVALAAMLLADLLWVPDGWSVLTLLLQAGIILWKHRTELARRPRARRIRARPT